MSKTNLRKASYSIGQLIKVKHAGSEKTKADTRIILIKAIKDLQTKGYILSSIYQLKPKHIDALISIWVDRGNKPATIKNNMAKLRWAATQIGKSNVIKRGNQAYQIPKRRYMSSSNKAIDHLDLSKITDPYIQLSIEAQQLFGLRREEAIKLVPSQADCGDLLCLKSTWTKGGIARQVPITNDKQRDFLARAKAFVGNNRSLIPLNSSNKNQVNQYISQTREAGMRNLHGLRHAYAQRRYREISQAISGKAYECPLRGGKLFKNMTTEERLLDKKVRYRIAIELGHSRRQIVAIYCG